MYQSVNFENLIYICKHKVSNLILSNPCLTTQPEDRQNLLSCP
jgi:hypothetical protein